MTKSCLSQWWMEDFWSIADTYLCMEQYMMAGKAALFSDQEIRKEILACSDPKQIKALGRKVRGFDQKVWDRFKYAIVLNGNWCKFSQNRDLREFLLPPEIASWWRPVHTITSGASSRSQLPRGSGPDEVARAKPAGLCSNGSTGRAAPGHAE